MRFRLINDVVVIQSARHVTCGCGCGQSRDAWMTVETITLKRLAKAVLALASQSSKPTSDWVSMRESDPEPEVIDLLPTDSTTVFPDFDKYLKSEIATAYGDPGRNTGGVPAEAAAPARTDDKPSIPIGRYRS